MVWAGVQGKMIYTYVDGRMNLTERLVYIYIYIYIPVCFSSPGRYKRKENRWSSLQSLYIPHDVGVGLVYIMLKEHPEQLYEGA